MLINSLKENKFEFLPRTNTNQHEQRQDMSKEKAVPFQDSLRRVSPRCPANIGQHG
jgi:hypothetical protein